MDASEVLKNLDPLTLERAGEGPGEKPHPGTRPRILSRKKTPEVETEGEGQKPGQERLVDIVV
jgi:hypothetical protein